MKDYCIDAHICLGSLINTWKQGLWNSEDRLVLFHRPPAPPARPPKRTRHSRTTLMDPPYRSKRPKLCLMNSGFDDCKIISPKSGINDCDNNANKIDVLGLKPSIRLRNMGDFVLEVEEKCKNAVNTTDSKTIDSTYSKCWIGDWLPADCPGVRVIAVNYSTEPLWQPTWIRKQNRTSLVTRSREMVELLTEYNVGVGHPIIWVGHSKGGIFIKQIMVDAWESGNQAFGPLWRSSRGCLFYSVPHRGSPLADFDFPLLRRSIELVEIKKSMNFLKYKI